MWLYLSIRMSGSSGFGISAKLREHEGLDRTRLAGRKIDFYNDTRNSERIGSNFELIRRLIDEAMRRRLVLMVDHTFVYTGAVRKLHEIIRTETFGTLRYYDSTRVNLGLFQQGKDGFPEVNEAVAGPVPGGVLSELGDVRRHAGVEGRIPLSQGKQSRRQHRHTYGAPI